MLENIIKLLLYYKSLGDKTFDQLSDEELFHEPSASANSISIIVKHLWGNMLSRWTNFLTEDGEKDWRDRDGEFNATIKTREELMIKWEEGWSCFIGALKELSEDDLNKIIYIRNEGHTVIDAIHRQLAHYSSHIGQIMYIGKIIKRKEWISLSIPKGGSAEYNSAKFNEAKTKKHFTDEV
jgi:hypothetical protein